MERDKHNEYLRKYYHENKSKILQRNGEKIQCGCGSVVNRASMTRHKRSYKHRLFEEHFKLYDANKL